MSTQIYQTYTFNPTKISGCQLWLDAADLTTLFTNAAGTTAVTASGQNVGCWKDKSSQANNATNSTNRPTVVYNSQNGLPAINFVGSSSQNLSLDPTKLPNGSTNFTYFFVVKTTSNAVQVFFTNGATVTNRMPQFYFSGYALVGDLFGGSAISDGTTYNNQFVVATYTGAAQFNGYDNDTLFSGTNNINVSLNTGTTYALVGVSRIADGSPVFYLTGQVAEIIVYNRVLSTTERQQVNGYLAWKWDLENNFQSSFPYFKSPPFMNQIQLPATPSGPITVTNSPVFTPTQISGCQLWIDAAQDTNINGAFINTITDRSISAYSITSVTNNTITLTRPGLNNLPVYNFGANRMKVSNQNWRTRFTIALVTQANSGFFLYSQWISNTYRNYVYGGNWNLIYINALDFNDSVVGQGTTATGTGWTIVIYQYGLTGSPPPWRLNGTQRNTTYISGTYPSDTSSTGDVFINGNGNSTFDTSRVAEILYYNESLSVAQCQQLEGYLAWKWGLQASLPTNHPYYRSPFPNMSMAPTPVFPPQISSATWIPTRISGISLWLDAADKSTLTGTTVTSWTDKSGAGNTATASAGPIQSTYNNYPVLSFNGSSQFMNSTNTIPRTTHTLIAVHRPATITGNSQGNTSLFRYQATNYIVFPYMLGTTPRGYITNADGTGAGSIDFQNSTLVENSVTNSLNIIIAVISSGSQIIYKNGTQQSSDTETLTGGTSDSLIIGRLSASGEYYQGDLGEMIVYPTALSTRNRQNIEGYLAWKWGLVSSLPSTHPYKLFPPVP